MMVQKAYINHVALSLASVDISSPLGCPKCRGHLATAKGRDIMGHLSLPG